MGLTLGELENKLKEMRDNGATEDTAILFDGLSRETDFERETYPNIYYMYSDHNAGSIVIDLY